MKKIFLIYLLLFNSSITFAFATAKEIKIDVQFDSKPNSPFYDYPLHIKKMIKINSNKNMTNIVMAQSRIVNKFPYTLALLVKSTEPVINEITLQFNLVNYSFNQLGGIIAQ